MELNDTIHNETEHASTSLKVLLFIFAVALVGALGYLVWYQNNASDSTEEPTVTAKTSGSGSTESNDTNSTAATTVDPCDFTAVTATVVPGVTYNIFGEEAFSTIVCGYIHTENKNMGMLDEVLMKNVASIAVTKFKDAAFKAKIDEGIASDNNVNSKIGNDYLLGCGCLENNAIVASPSPAGGLMSVADQAKFIASTKAAPVIMKLSYEVHGGSGCSCCTLFEKAEVL